METTDGEPTNYPNSITIPSDGDGKIKAADVNVAFEGLADRTAFLKAAQTPLANIAALKAIDTTSVATGTIRCVTGRGFYAFSTTAAYDQDPYRVAPTTGGGCWTRLETAGRVRVAPVQIAAMGKSSTGGGGDDEHEVGFAYAHPDFYVTDEIAGTLVEDLAGDSWIDADFAPIALVRLDPFVLDGHKLVAARARFQASHTEVPAFKPGFGIYSVSKTTGTIARLCTLTAGGCVYFSGLLAAYTPGVKTLELAIDADTYIDTSAFTYHARVVWPTGEGAETGSLWFMNLELEFD